MDSLNDFPALYETLYARTSGYILLPEKLITFKEIMHLAEEKVLYQIHFNEKSGNFGQQRF